MSRACVWSFDGGPLYPGVTDDTRWNGFLNVRVTPETREQVAARFTVADGFDEADAADLRALPVGADGLVSLANGYATTGEDCEACDAPAVRIIPAGQSLVPVCAEHDTCACGDFYVTAAGEHAEMSDPPDGGQVLAVHRRDACKARTDEFGRIRAWYPLPSRAVCERAS